MPINKGAQFIQDLGKSTASLAHRVRRLETMPTRTTGMFNADSYTSLQAALLAAAGKTLILSPRTTYEIYEELLIYPYTTILGNEAILKVAGDIGFNMFTGVSGAGLRFFDLELDGNKANVTGNSSGILLVSYSRTIIENCYVHDFTNVGIVGAGLVNSRITNCDVIDCGSAIGSSGHGIFLYGAISDVRIDNNFVKQAYAGGILVSTNGTDPISDVNIVDNDAKDCGGIGIYLAGDKAHYVTRSNLVGNIASGNVDQIELAYGDGCTLTGNTGTEGTVDGIVLHNSKDCTVTANTANENSARGFNIQDSTRITISGNTAFSNNNDNSAGIPGISLYGSTHCTVVGNECFEVGGHQKYGIAEAVALGHPEYNLIEGNKCYGNEIDSYLIIGTNTQLIDHDSEPIDYSDLSYIIGWDSYTTKKIKYKKIGRMMDVWFEIIGVSNSVNTSFTLPVENQSGMEVNEWIRARDNTGTYGSGLATLSNYTSQLLFTSNVGGSGWTASGTKAIIGHFSFLHQDPAESMRSRLLSRVLTQQVTLQYSSATLNYVWIPMDGGIYWVRLPIYKHTTGFWGLEEAYTYRLLDGVPDTDGGITYTPAPNWTHNANASALNGTQSYPDGIAGRYLEFTVTGTERIYIACDRQNYTGYGTVTIGGSSSLVNGEDTSLVGGNRVINTYVAVGAPNGWFEIATKLNPAASYTVRLAWNATVPPGSAGANLIFNGYGVPCSKFPNANGTLTNDTVQLTKLTSGNDWGYAYYYQPTGTSASEFTGGAHLNEANPVVSWLDQNGVDTSVSVGAPMKTVDLLELVQTGNSRHSQLGSVDVASFVFTMRLNWQGVRQTIEHTWLIPGVMRHGYDGMIPCWNTNMNRGALSGDGGTVYVLTDDDSSDKGKKRSRLAIMYGTTHPFLIYTYFPALVSLDYWDYSLNLAYLHDEAVVNKIYFHRWDVATPRTWGVGDIWSSDYWYGFSYKPSFIP